jgi:hypothetical protein
MTVTRLRLDSELQVTVERHLTRTRRRPGDGGAARAVTQLRIGPGLAGLSKSESRPIIAATHHIATGRSRPGRRPARRVTVTRRGAWQVAYPGIAAPAPVP